MSSLNATSSPRSFPALRCRRALPCLPYLVLAVGRLSCTKRLVAAPLPAGNTLRRKIGRPMRHTAIDGVLERPHSEA